jgi:hypothetical protein
MVKDVGHAMLGQESRIAFSQESIGIFKPDF